MTERSRPDAGHPGIAILLVLLAGLVLSACGTRPPPEPVLEPPLLLDGFDPGRISAPIRINGERVPYRTFFRTIAPGGKAVIDLGSADLSVEAQAGHLDRRFGKVWTAPDRPGAYALLFRDRESGHARAMVTMFVTVPAEAAAGGGINGYEIGPYPAEPYMSFASYLPPFGFIEVTEEMLPIRVTPHFTLGQFLSRQESAFPKYLLLDPHLLVKLEQILEELNRLGHRNQTLHVMSAFRPPNYNRRIGSGIYSRHVYGAAADVYPDSNPRDGLIDDLNGDGLRDVEDALWLAELVERMYADGKDEALLGGVAAYAPNPFHGPFVHVDVRGWSTRWGLGAPSRTASLPGS